MEQYKDAKDFYEQAIAPNNADKSFLVPAWAIDFAENYAAYQIKSSPAKAEQEGPWKSMEQEEPKYGMLRFVRGVILKPEPGITNGETVATINQFWAVSKYQTSTKRWYCEIHDSNKKVTHWMDIPPLESTTPPVKEVSYDELWDEFSEHIDDDIDSLSRVAGGSVLTERQYNKLVAKLKAAPVKEAGQPTLQVLQNLTLADIDAPTFTHTAEFRKHFDYIKGKFIEALKGRHAPAEPIDGPWKPGCVVEHPHPESGCVSEVKTWITDGKTTIHIDDWNLDDIDDGEVRLASFLNLYEFKLSIDRSSEHVAAHYESEANRLNSELQSIKARQPAPSGLRWIRITTADSLPPDDNSPDPPKYFVQYQMSDNGVCPEYFVDFLTASEIANECQGCDWFEWLSDSPAHVQVDPVKFAEWFQKNVSIYGDMYTIGDKLYHGPQLPILYTQSLQNKP